jgi:thymidylate synthase (FAD)
VRLDEIPFWIPPRIRENHEAARIFRETVEYLENQQRRLADLYKISELPFAQKKALTSDFRRIAPEGLGTGIVFTCNIRALRHVIEMRTSRHAEFEIRLVFSEVARISRDKWPMLFQDFTYDTFDGVNEWKPKHSKV